MDKELLYKYILGFASTEESSAVRSWISENDENKQEYIQYKNSLALTSALSSFASNLEAGLDLKLVKEKLGLTTKGKNGIIFFSIFKYVAVSLVFLAIGYFTSILIHKSDSNDSVSIHEMTAPSGEMSELKLADGTKVWLNSASTLKFPSSFESGSREVCLIGEAFFDVKENLSSPFIINLPETKIKVTGTSLNVKAYPTLKKTEITLVEGLVEIIDNKDKSLACLMAGQQFVYNKQPKKGLITTIDTRPYEVWKDGKLVFRDKKLVELARDMELWYNIKLVFANRELEEYRYSGTIIKNYPLDQILEVIKLTAPIDYKIEVYKNKQNVVTIYKLEKE